MVSRGLAVPAVVCLALGVVLGVWGWGQRDEARARIVPQEEVIEVGGPFGPGAIDAGQRRDDVCALLLTASRLEPPPFLVGPGGIGTPPTGPETTISTNLLGVALSTVLDPSVVVGLPGLDRPDVRAAIEGERRAIDIAVADGDDITVDPEVVRSAAVLGQAIGGVC